MITATTDPRRLRDLADLGDEAALAELVRFHRRRGELEEAAMLRDRDSMCDLAANFPSPWILCLREHKLRHTRTISNGQLSIKNYTLGFCILENCQYPAWIMAAPQRARAALLVVAYGLQSDGRAWPSMPKEGGVTVDFRADTALPWQDQRSVVHGTCRFYGTRGRRRDATLAATAPTERLARLRLAHMIRDRLLAPDQGFASHLVQSSGQTVPAELLLTASRPRNKAT